MNGEKIADFGIRLHLVRISMGLSQEEMADLLGHSRNTQNAYESGRRDPGTLRAREIADQLGVPFPWLAGIGKTFSFDV